MRKSTDRHHQGVARLAAEAFAYAVFAIAALRLASTFWRKPVVDCEYPAWIDPGLSPG
ncbi:hypothetical protein [Hyphomicrobium facile]|uniref:hypothetical protein n=1 Tax=Hyphomicrobium facile TaxID=51670 RepID=UPI0015A686A1|nr:hypothetical protein [Hyphomicrobium facile]